MTDPLYGVKSKIGRAREQLEALDAEIAGVIDAFRKGEAYTIVPERDPNTREEVHRLRLREPLPIVRWGITTGIIVHLARSALDNLIEVLTTRHTGQALPGTEFPVFKDRDLYGLTVRRGRHRGEPDPRSGAHKVRGIHPTAARLIEQLQPYNWPRGYQNSTVWVLHELWNLDKHRIPPIVGFAGLVMRTGFKGGLTRNATFALRFPLEDGAEVGRIDPDPDPNAPYMEMDFDLMPEIAFGDGPGVGAPVVDALGRCVSIAAQIATDCESFPIW